MKSVLERVEHFEIRRRQLLRALSDLEEKYSIRSSKLLEQGHVLEDVVVRGREGEVGRELTLWLLLYEELKRLEGLRDSLEYSSKERKKG